MGCCMLRLSRLAWPALPFLATISSASAQTATLAGEWLATPLRADWVIGDWGDGCGPRPSGGGAPAGNVRISKSGSELVFAGAGRTYSTTECWEQSPGLNRISHSASARSFKNVCKSSPQDARQSTVITTITATDNQITFDETGQYQFVIGGQNCTASVRRTRFLRLVQREGEAPVEQQEPSAAPSATAEPAPTRTPSVCATPGDPARLEVRPSRKLLRPGETFTYRASVIDRNGCQLNVTPSFRLVGTPLGIELAGPGMLRVSEDAGEGEVKLLASIADRSVTVVAEIVARERYDSLLHQGQFDGSGESTEAAITRIETGSIGARGAVLHDESGARRKWFIAIVGSAAMLLGFAGFVAVRRQRRREDQDRGLLDERDEELAAAARSERSPGPPQTPPKAMVCPTCREEYPEAARFCSNDGNRLIPLPQGMGAAPAGGVCPTCGQGYDPGVATCPKHDEPLIPPTVYAAALESRQLQIRKICPMCGAQSSGESVFCGNCGAALVPVN